ncbi:DUF1080 domain-containing protein [Aliifodinibius sp. S!AR15-10]|uniref:DUF1080 domain-containing protein n=1 Tax=Aliifodinibius sp. S!AR15-10 TaxID=2950437 RepID=UPI002857C7FF|nr:family 16 glycoside hydrolase [Aliifodinibius sp. S!AR15-10]MDR8392127.1 DUF1080 domain-containing protein [Aliifodinibius sp. S!AR15-10]
MKRFKALSVFFLTVLLVSCSSSNEILRSGSDIGITESQFDEITEIVALMPADDKAERDWLNERLLEMGSPALHALFGMLKSPGTGSDTNARYAVNGLTKYVSRPGAEPEHSMYEEVLISELRSSHAPSVKIFLMEQLELVGSDEAVPVLRSFVGDDALNESAAHALRSINISSAENALLQGIGSTQDEHRIVLIKALGDMEASSQDVVSRLQPLAAQNDPATKEAVLYALASSGNPSASGVVTTSGTVQQQLRFARRLAEEGHPQQSAEVARGIYEGYHAVNSRIEALHILVKAESETPLELLLEGSQSTEPELRSAALKIAQDLQQPDVTNEFTGLLEQNEPAVQANIIAMLGRRGDSSAWSAIQPYLEDRNPEVRLAAVSSSVSLAGTEALPSLLTALNRARLPQEIDAIKQALLQLPSDPMFEAASERWENTSNHAKVALLEVLAERQESEYLDEVLGQLSSSSSEVRRAMLLALDDLAGPEDLPQIINLLNSSRTEEEIEIIQKAIASIADRNPDAKNRAAPIVNALNQTSSKKAVILLEILPEVGGNQAVEAVIPFTNHSQPAVRSTAISALANWSDSYAIQPLLSVIGETSSSQKMELIRGLTRLVRESKYSDQEKVAYLSQAMSSATTDEQKTALISALSNFQSPASLRTVSKYFGNANQSIRESAMRAAAEILAPSYDFSEEFDGTDKALSVLEATTDSTTKNKIEGYISEIQTQQQASEGFTSLFNGEDLSGWTGATDAYTVQNGNLIHKDGQSGNLFTEQEYSDFILRFQFKLTPGANNGLAIRSPLQGDPAYQAMELQILDNTAEKYAELEPYQYHGSVYGVAAAERGHLKPAGEWNTQEVVANGSQITVKLNGVTILDTDIEEAGSPEAMDGREHPGLLRPSGHIGFLGHGDEVAFRNIQIRDLNVFYPDYSMGTENGGGMNHPPEGFKALFNGQNLEGWEGLFGNPETRAEMSPEERAKAQKEANIEMQQHWSVRDEILYFDGNGKSLVTKKDYKDFEMLLDWKIEPGGDSGVYLRGTPQVQIWDITENPVGSGGLYNNQKNLSEPLIPADNAIGEWNRMRIKMIGERVTVHLNGQLVVPNVVLENYWDRDKPIYSKGQIELQAHNTPLYFKNVFIRDIFGSEPLFNGKDLSGWQRVGGNAGSWNASDGLLYTEGDGQEWEKGSGGGWLSTDKMYDNFKLVLEYRLPEGGNSGVFLRAPHKGDPAFQGIEIQLLDDYAEQYGGLEPWQYTGSIYDVKAPSKHVSKQAGEWQKMEIVANGPKIKVALNGQLVISTNLINHMKKVGEHPGLKQRKGYIGLQNHNSRVEFRNIEITEIK